MTVTVQEGINEVDTGIKFDLQFNYDDDDSDYKDSTECRLTIAQLSRWLRIRVVEPPVAIMETFLMVKPDEFWALVEYYKGKITESTLLDKAAHVAAKAKLLSEDTSTPAALKEPVVKELLMQERKLTDKLR